jgi:tellurite resistance protein TerC
VLLLGVVGALVMRAIMIWVGVWLISRFHWVIYPFAALLLIAALRLLFGESTERRLVKEACAACGTWVARIVPVTPYMQDQRFFLHRGGRWVATPLFVALILIETTDIIFALDSIPGCRHHHAPSIYTSNVFAMLGCARSTLCWGRG